MKNVLLNFCRNIVGPETGFCEEGNEQWYYFLSLAINSLLIAWLKPEVVVWFILLMVIHSVTVCIYYQCIRDYEAKYAYMYFASHLLLFTVAIILNPLWALITTAISVVAFLMAPNCKGNNLLLRKKSYSKLALIFNAIIFAAFVMVACLLPIKTFLKILIILAMMSIHPIVDYIASECRIITYEVINKALDNIRQARKKK